MNPLDTDIKYLKGVGPAKAKLLGNELGIFTLRDLLYHIPYKYIDRSIVQRVVDLADGMSFVQLRGKIVSATIEGEGRKERLIATFTDGTGYIELVWFNGLRRLKKGLNYETTYLLLGRPTAFNGRMNISHPELEDARKLTEGPIAMQAHYHLTERVKRQFFTSRTLGDLVTRTFEILGERAVPETLPLYFVKKYNLISLDQALRTLHAPSSSAALPDAVRRMKFEELFFLQLDILRYARDRQSRTSGFRFPKVGRLFHSFYHDCIPFDLTEAQKRVVREIRADLATGRQMNRLLQGDVGSGKTMVALLSCLLALDNGFQACVMAPTEILAEQHFTSISEMLKDLPVRVALLTGNVKGKARREVLQGIADGTIRLLIGTHALIQPNVGFLNLGARRNRRAAPLRCGTARQVVAKEHRTSPHSRDDRHTDTPHAGHDRLR